MINTVTISGMREVVGTAVLRVDYGGRGDFSSIKDACDYAAVNSPDVDANFPPFGTFPENWTIVVSPGLYTEQPFEIPPMTRVVSEYVAEQRIGIGNHPIVIMDLTSGDGITMKSDAKMEGLAIMTRYQAATGDINLVNLVTDNGPTDYFTISNCLIRPMLSGTAHEINAVNFDAESKSLRFFALYNTEILTNYSTGSLGNCRGMLIKNQQNDGRTYMIRSFVQATTGDPTYGVIADNATVLLDHVTFEGWTVPVDSINGGNVSIYGVQGATASQSDGSSSISAVLPTVPTGTSSPGVPGQITADDDNIYVCTANGWKQKPLDAMPNP